MKVVTFGELMIRLQPYNYERFVQADHLEFSFGGGEANVAVSLANYGMDAAYVTKLPAHAIGQAAVNSLRRYGVDTSMIVRGGDRVGIYFNEKGASQRGSVCIYDRAHSAIQEATTADFDWNAIFEGVDWFLSAGITLASAPAGGQIRPALNRAMSGGQGEPGKYSCCLTYERMPRTLFEPRARREDVQGYKCGSNAARRFRHRAPRRPTIYAGEINREGYKSVAKQLADKFGFEKVANTLRESHTASDNGWSAMHVDVKSGEYCFSKKYELRTIDRVAGIAFCGGLILGLLIRQGPHERHHSSRLRLSAQAHHPRAHCHRSTFLSIGRSVERRRMCRGQR